MGHHNQPPASMQAPSEADYLIPDMLRPGLDLVLCGTALGAASAKARAYYAHPQNKFWRTLAAVGLTPETYHPSDYARLLDHNIGLTDLCKTASGNDDELPSVAIDPASLRAKIEMYQPRYLAFTSLTGARWFLKRSKATYGLQSETIGQTQIFALHSTSPRASGAWNDSSWRELAALIFATRR